MPKNRWAMWCLSTCRPWARKSRRAASAAVVESVKAASDVYAPLTGEVVEVNSALEDDPAKVNADAEGDGWFIKIKMSDTSELDDMMDADGYKAFVEAEA